MKRPVSWLAALIVVVASSVLTIASSGVVDAGPGPAPAVKRQSLPGVVHLSTSWALRDSLTTGSATIGPFTYGTRPLVPIMGDWDGNGSKTPGTYEAGTFKLSNSTSGAGPITTITFGDPRGFPVTGDFDGNGTDDLAVVKNGLWQIHYLGPGAPADTSFMFGPAVAWPAVVPVAGHWTGTNVDGIGTYNLMASAGTVGQWNLRNTATAGAADTTFVFNPGPSPYPVVGDWTASGTTTVGVKAGTTWNLSNSNTAPATNIAFDFGLANDFPVVWTQPDPTAVAQMFSGAVGNTTFGVGTSPAQPSTTASGSVLTGDTNGGVGTLTAVTSGNPIATTNGGSVTMNADGTFTYQPPVGFTGSDSFTYTVTNGFNIVSNTATITVANKVWYVKNNDTGANTGSSIAPFHTLAQAQTASGVGDFIYVFKGDGTASGQNAGIVLKTNQHLIGQAQNLVVGTATLFTGASANRPLITASSGSVVALSDGSTVAGLAANPSGTADGVSGSTVVSSGATVNDVTIADTGSGEGIRLANSAGTVAITNTNVSGGADDAMVVTNSLGALNLTLTGDAFAESNTVTGNDAVNITTTGSAAVNPTISMTSFTAARGDLFQLDIGDTSTSTLSFMNNTLSNNNTNIVSGGGGFIVSAGGGTSPAATLHFDIENNTFRDSLGNAVGIGNNSGTNTVSGKFSNNTIGVQAVADSGSAQGSDLVVAGIAGGSIGITAENNKLYQYNNFGAEFQTTSTFSLDAKFDGNTIATPSTTNTTFTIIGLDLNAGTATGSTNAVCFDAFSNSLTGSGKNASNHDIRLRQRTTTTVRLPGFPSFGGQTAAQFTIAQNGGTPTAITAGTFGGGAACTTP